MEIAPLENAPQGEELERVSLEPCYVHLIFSDTVIQIGVKFSLVSAGAAISVVDPATRSGDLSIIWKLVGLKVEEVQWDEIVAIKFIGGVSLVIEFGLPGRRGTIMNRHVMTVEDF